MRAKCGDICYILNVYAKMGAKRGCDICIINKFY